MRKLLFVAIGTLIFGSATSYASYPGPSEMVITQRIGLIIE